MSQYWQFMRDRRGNVAITFALLLTALLGVAGLAIDYAVAVHRKKSLDAALDAAILAGAQAASVARSAGNSDWRELGKATIRTMFRANIPNGQNYETLGFTPEIELDGAEIKATASYSAQSFTSFMSIFDQDTVGFGSTAEAQISAANYIDVSFLIDNSFSMGIGATVASQNLMLNIGGTNKGCALACHFKDIYNTSTVTPAQARAANATLRIDVIRDATKAAIEKLQQTVTGSSDRLRIGLYTFSNGLTTLKAPSTDIQSVLSAANQIDLDTSNYGGGTYLSHALKTLRDLLPKGGSGSSVADRLSFVVLFTDGIEDSARLFKVTPQNGGNYGFESGLGGYEGVKWWTTNSRAGAPTTVNSFMQAFDPNYCKALSSTASSTKGNHAVLAIRIRYEVGAGASSDKNVKFIQTPAMQTAIQNAFTGCVSRPDYYITAGSTAEIGPAFGNITAKIIGAKGVALSN